jgi:hypothetical protein
MFVCLCVCVCLCCVALQGISLALSLHAPTQELRLTIVPSARAYPLEKLMTVSQAQCADQCLCSTRKCLYAQGHACMHNDMSVCRKVCLRVPVFCRLYVSTRWTPISASLWSTLCCQGSMTVSVSSHHALRTACLALKGSQHVLGHTHFTVVRTWRHVVRVPCRVRVLS